MINLYYSGSGTQHIAIWPEVTASSYPITSSFVLDLVQEYDRSSGSIDLTLSNQPNRVSPRLVFSLNRNEVPQYSGMYEAYLREVIIEPPVWGTTQTKWTNASWRWSDSLYTSSLDLTDNERAWVSGSDFSTFNQYTTSSTETIYDSGSAYPSTEYVSPDETGAYKTYHV